MPAIDKASYLKLSDVLKTKDRFLDYCDKHGLLLAKNYLDFYEQEGLLQPITEEYGAPLYSPFQLFRVYILEHYILHSLSKIQLAPDEEGKLVQQSPFDIKRILNLNRDSILQRDDEFYRILGLLHHLEPFYCSTFSVTNYLRELGFDNLNGVEVGDWLKAKRNSGIASEVMSLYALDTDAIRWWQSAISMTARDIDPLANWYHLLKNFGMQDRQKIKRLKGRAALAQVFYQMEEILRGVIYDVTKEKIMNPHDIIDLRGGKWRIAQDKEGKEIACAKCGNAPVWLKTLDARHQDRIMCDECTTKLFREVNDRTVNKRNGTYSSEKTAAESADNIPAQTPLNCDHCGRTLLKGLNEGFIIDSTRSGALAIELQYGEMLVHVKCKECEKITIRDISIGWDTSPGS